jgi:hypothetical protein
MPDEKTPTPRKRYGEVEMQYREITIPRGTTLTIPYRSIHGAAPDVQIIEVRELPYDKQELWKIVLVWR